MNCPTPYGISFFFGWLFITVVHASPVIEWDFREGLQDWKGYEITKPA
jgi:hypothetical protein